MFKINVKSLKILNNLPICNHIIKYQKYTRIVIFFTIVLTMTSMIFFKIHLPSRFLFNNNSNTISLKRFCIIVIRLNYSFIIKSLENNGLVQGM